MTSSSIAIISLLSAAVLGHVDERCENFAVRPWMVEYCVEPLKHRSGCKTWFREQGEQGCVDGRWTRVVREKKP